MVERLSRILFAAAVGCLTLEVHAGEGCDPSFMHQYEDSVRIVDSLRPEKAGQMQVYAIDGSQFTAGQSRWMQGQLGLASEACARGDRITATRLMNDVQSLLKSHRRTS